MAERLPEGLFRDSPAEPSPEAAEGAASSPQADPAAALPEPSWSRGTAPRVLAAGLIGALLLGFGAGRLFAWSSGNQPAPNPSASVTQPTTSTPSLDPATSAPQVTLVPYDGPTQVLTVRDAQGSCAQGWSADEPANLIDNNARTIWRCAGSGASEQIRFSLQPSDIIVGVRVVNGNTSTPGRFEAERRILAIRWAFSDGTYVVQGLSANDSQPQEIRFPPVTGVDWVTMTVLDATAPGVAEVDNDAVSISFLEFLTTG